MIKIESKEKIKGIYQNENYDFDRYNILERTALSTKEISITVSYIEDDKDKITGDIIAYGSWYDLDIEECLNYLKLVKEQGEMLRDFSQFISKKEN